ncbi:MAG TPA: helix-turn-helix domain-containing protein [Candidatus Paceibacterota bacterium]
MSTKYAPIIKNLRVKGGLSQLAMAEKLDLSRQSYMAIERGSRELSLKEAEKICDIFGISIKTLESGESPNYEKYKQMILAFLSIGRKIPKTKLAKLAYLADAGWYYYHLQSMSGMPYRKIQYGPVADPFFSILDELYNNGQIQIEQTGEGAMLVSQTRANRKKQLSEISEEELRLIKDIEEKWRSKKTKEIVAFTHNQLPYLCAADNEIISLGLITQEDPDEYY